MKYLNLSEEEVRSLKIIIRKKFLSAYLSSILGLIAISFSFIVLLRSFDIHLKGIQAVSVPQVIFILLLSITGIMVINYLWINKSKFLLNAEDKKKKIYTGAISDKKVKNSNFYFYMDGNKYRVNKKDYNAFNVGDSTEFHVSVKDRYLLKVAKPAEERSEELE